MFQKRKQLTTFCFKQEEKHESFCFKKKKKHQTRRQQEDNYEFKEKEETTN